MPCTTRKREGSLREGDILENRFRVKRLVGSGSRSLVYEATHLVTGKSVAIKWARSPVTFASVLFQAQVAARVRHPHVLDIYDVGQQDGRFFLVMEYVAGASISQCIKQREILLPEFMRAFDSLLFGVHALHQRGLIHCDLKPTNVLLEHDDLGWPTRPKIIDFGSTVVVEARGSAREQNTDGTLTWRSPRACVAPQGGSEGYMAPEQRHSHLPDARTDVYALGKLLHRSLRGLLGRKEEGPLEQALCHIASRACATDPCLRFQSALALRAAIQDAQSK